MYQDPEVAQIIRRLDEKKRDAVKKERYDHAKKLKQAIADLQKVQLLRTCPPLLPGLGLLCTTPTGFLRLSNRQGVSPRQVELGIDKQHLECENVEMELEAYCSFGYWAVLACGAP